MVEGKPAACAVLVEPVLEFWIGTTLSLGYCSRKMTSKLTFRFKNTPCVVEETPNV